MKTYPAILIIGIITLSLSFNSCCDRHLSKCEGLIADTIPNQMIYVYDTNLHDTTIWKRINVAIDSGVFVDSCKCNSRIVLFGFPPEMNQDERHKVAEDDPDLEDRFTKFKNIEIKLDTDPVTYIDDTICTKTMGENPIVVAVIDGGINKKDPLLRKRLWVNPDLDNSCYITDTNGYDFITKFNNNQPREINKHGTEVSKLIVQDVNKNINVVLMDLRTFDKNGVGSLFHTLCALEYAVDHGADLINMSWGYYKSKMERNDSILFNYIKKARSRSALVAAAGNDAIDTDCCPHYPSSFYEDKFSIDHIISVAALTDENGGLAEFTNYGKKSVGVAAKGVFQFEQGLLEGTSYAAPLVTKKIVLLLNEDPHLPNYRIIECIENNATPLRGFDRCKIKEGELNTETIPCQ